MVTTINRLRSIRQQRYRQSMTGNLLTGQRPSNTQLNATISINQSNLTSNTTATSVNLSTSDSINSSPDATMSVTEILATPTSVTQRRSLRTQRLPVRFREVEPPIPITIRRRAPNNPSRQPRADETNDNQRRSRRPRAPPVESLPDDPPLPVDDVNTVFDNAHDVESIDLGELSERCHYCNALFFRAERNSRAVYTKCCDDGKVRLSSHHRLTPLMYSLLTGIHPKSTHFISNSVYYNNAFAMCSIGAKSEILARGGPLVIKLNGIVMHNTSWIQPRPDEPHRYAQIYILDPQQAVHSRLSRCPTLDLLLVEELEEDLRSNNRLVQTYSFLKDVYDRALLNDENVQSLTMLMRDEREINMGRFTAPLINDIAVVFRANEGFQKDPMDLLIHQSNGGLIRVRESHPLLNAFTYPMLYPTGGEGYKQGMKIYTAHLPKTYIRTKLTMHMYYAFMIAIRRHPTSNSPTGFNPLLSAGPLTQLFLIDVDQRCIKERLEFLKHNQDKIFAVKYKDLERAVRYRYGPRHIPGMQVVLPSSFPGSPRNLQQLYIKRVRVSNVWTRPKNLQVEPLH